MEYTYNRYLSTQSDVVYEIVKVLRIFFDGDMNNEELEDTVIYYVKTYARLLFDVDGKDELLFKGFPKQKLGKKRIRIIAACLENRKLIEFYDEKKSGFVAPKLMETIF